MRPVQVPDMPVMRVPRRRLTRIKRAMVGCALAMSLPPAARSTSA
jgi:hypothetical protein